MNATERNDEASSGFSPDLIEERIKANCEEELFSPYPDLCPNTIDAQINPEQIGPRI